MKINNLIVKHYKPSLLFVFIFLIISNSFSQAKSKTNRTKSAKRVVKSERVINESVDNDIKVSELGYYIQNAIFEDSLDNYMSKFDTRAFGKLITSKTERDKSLNEYRKGYLTGINLLLLFQQK